MQPRLLICIRTLRRPTERTPPGSDTQGGFLKLAAVAVTDHDTVSGLDEAEAAGREYGVEIIRGASSAYRAVWEIHLLGLWLPGIPPH
ncbi:MAG: hypothetical protein ACLRWP_03775 [Bilophila wadsworthia]